MKLTLLNVDEILKEKETYASKNWVTMLEYVGKKCKLYYFDEYEYNEQTEEFDKFACTRALTRREVINEVNV